MTRRVLRLTIDTLQALGTHLDLHKGEDACFFLFRRLEAADREIIIVRRVVAISEEHVLRRAQNEILFEGAALVKAFTQARLDGSFLGFAHSHPKGAVRFSEKDDIVDRSVLHTITNRLETQPYFPSLIWADGKIANARVWTRQGVNRPIDTVSNVGSRLSYQTLPVGSADLARDDMFSRQVNVISRELQSSFSQLRIGVVGLGGTGSALIAQLTRLGVGEVVLVDPDQIERSNVNRVHGAALRDVGIAKSTVAEAFVRSIGVGTLVRAIDGNIADQDIAKAVGTCDVIFGCTDDELGRSILSRLAYSCLVPVFDMAVKIDPAGAKIRSIDGRVTTLLPEEACLDCRQRITGAGIRADALRRYSPEQAETLERDGYLGRADINAPAVVTFTTATAAYALNEFLHRLMGLYGEERKSSEILIRFLDGRVGMNRKLKRDGCYCYRAEFIGSGDKKPFLGLMWQS